MIAGTSEQKYGISSSINGWKFQELLFIMVSVKKEKSSFVVQFPDSFTSVLPKHSLLSNKFLYVNTHTSAQAKLNMIFLLA
jgi:hypothetical protein